MLKFKEVKEYKFVYALWSEPKSIRVKLYVWHIYVLITCII